MKSIKMMSVAIMLLFVAVSCQSKKNEKKQVPVGELYIWKDSDSTVFDYEDCIICDTSEFMQTNASAIASFFDKNGTLNEMETVKLNVTVYDIEKRIINYEFDPTRTGRSLQ